jgi:hypothetical protein
MSVVVGIDVGPYKYAAAVCQSDCREGERRVFRYRSNRAGFRQLDVWLQSAQMQLSGWCLSRAALRVAAGQSAVQSRWSPPGGEVLRQEPSATDQVRRRRRAQVAALEAETNLREPLVGVELREAARFCMRLVEQQANLCQRIRRLVEIGFRELGQVFEDPTCDSALAVLRRAPTARAAPVGTCGRWPTRCARVARRLGDAKARRLQELARETVAPLELDALDALEIELLLEQYDLLGRQI